MNQEFAQAPISLGERKAEQGDNCDQWTPRELLISYLRKIDSGAFVPDGLIILHLKHQGEDALLTGMRRAKVSILETVGVLEVAKNDLINHAGDL